MRSLRVLLVVVAVAFAELAHAGPVGAAAPTGGTACSVSGTVNVRCPPYNARGNGTTDDAAAFTSAIAAAMNAGAVLVVPAGTYRIDSVLTLPNDGANPPKQKPLRIVGSGAHMSGRGTAIVGGSVLDLRGTGSYGKIVTSGLGLLELSGITLTDTSAGSTPFLYTTNTTLHVHDSAFIGAKSGTACDQDAIILGGTEEIEGQGGLTHSFQGYGTVIHSNFFNGIRRAVYARVHANSVVVRDNTVWHGSGSNLPGGAAIEFDHAAVAPAATMSGSVIAGNLIEVSNYVYAIKLGRASQLQIIANSAWDPGVGTLAAVRFEADAIANLLIDGYVQGTPAVATVSDATDQRNTHLGIDEWTVRGRPTFRHTEGVSAFAGVFTGQNPDSGEPAPLTVHPTLDQLNATKLFSLRRSDAAGYRPGSAVFDVNHNGELGYWHGSLVNMGLTWQSYPAAGPSTDGLNLKLDAGTAGGVIDLQASRARFLTSSGDVGVVVNPGSSAIELGTGSVAVRAGAGSPEGGITAPVGSLYLRTDGGAGSTLYVKETGTGANGWIAK